MEEWKTIEGWPEYEVSDRGRVRRAMPGRTTRVGRILGSKVGAYSMVCLRRPGTKGVKAYVHHLVLDVFGPPKPSPDHECNHIDGDKKNNCIENLEWVTRKENVKHAIDSGLVPTRNGMPGEKNHNAKLKRREVVEIRHRHDRNGEIKADLAREYGVTDVLIGKIVRREAWRHVP